MKISIVVTSWNGLPLLKKNLPQVIKTSQIASEIIVTDDASEDETLEYLQHLSKSVPNLKIISHRENQGFIRNSNNAVQKASGELVVLLNNDIFTHPNYIENSLSHFNDPKVFGVGFAEVNNPNFSSLEWKEGYIQHHPSTSNKTHISGWLSGGSSIIRRSEYLKLGGFDPVYEPFYCEDLDLGYRAWKSGYRLLWEPSSHLEHHHESTMSKFPKKLLDYVKERNRLLNVWRNITDEKMLFQNRLSLVNRVLFGPNYIKIIRAAKKQIGKYPKPIVFPAITDTAIFELFKND